MPARGATANNSARERIVNVRADATFTERVGCPRGFGTRRSARDKIFSWNDVPIRGKRRHTFSQTAMLASCSGSNDSRVRPPNVGPLTVPSPLVSSSGARDAGNEPQPPRRIGFVQGPTDGASPRDLPQDLEDVREELHAALHRARVHLEWTEIMLLLVAFRRGERDVEDPGRAPGESGSTRS
jgi:hypothetical protein